MKEYLELLAKITAPLTIAVLVLSITYEWGYLTVIGSEFVRFASATDYLRNAVAWFPYTLAGLVAGIAIHGLFRRFAKWQSDEKIIKRAANPRLARKLSVYPQRFLPIFFLALAADEFLFRQRDSVVIYGLTFFACWPYLVYFIFHHANAPKLNVIAFRIGAFVPGILVIIFFLGMNSGYYALKKTEDFYIVRLNKNPQEMKVIVLRGFERGILLRDITTDLIQFHLWTEIISVERTAYVIDKNSRVCSWTGWFCN